MAADDVTIAILGALKAACDLLSDASGRDDSPVRQEFSIKDIWYRFELGWDLHGDRPLLKSELYTIITKLQEVNRRYNMRQVTFKYLLEGRFHAVGRLRNPVTPPPPRQIAQVGPKYLNLPYGHIVWSDFVRPMDFEAVAIGMIGLLDHSWHCMADFHRSSSRIPAGKNPFTYHDKRASVKFEVWAPATLLSLEELMDLAYYTAEFGRLYFMREHRVVFTSTYYPTPIEINGALSRGVE
ncbi:MAG: hypothetical protein LQ346_008240 [Caloplaca aetnensis]|nr:MAG: hypothetical protein LQ346_008240 [Caloplaca aetnensis]